LAVTVISNLGFLKLGSVSHCKACLGTVVYCLTSTSSMYHQDIVVISRSWHSYGNPGRT